MKATIYRGPGEIRIEDRPAPTTVENYDWTVQPMGRDATTVTVVISENGV